MVKDAPGAERQGKRRTARARVQIGGILETVRLGKSGLSVSKLGLGAMSFGSPSWRSWVLDEEKARPIIKHALDLGFSLIDTCDYYSLGESEAMLGRLLGGLIPRNEVVIATKLGFAMGKGPNNRGYGRKHIFEAVDTSLRRLRTDRIDLLQTHIWDVEAPIEEMVTAFDDLVRAGKVLYVGATDMPSWQFAKAVYFARHNGLAEFSTMQNHYNLVWRGDETELIPFCRSENIGLLPYSPMGRGFLCGTRRNTEQTTPRSRDDEYTLKWYGRAQDAEIARRLEDLSGHYSASPAQLALAWVLQQPIHAPIIGATRIEHLDEAVGALKIKLDPAHCNELQSMYLPRHGYQHK
ncbi:MAG TPA: aldo/keto reductase [Dongiaceae bacterium]|nr:aldo/keto reductase [Dongiaceae bacterium]